MDSSKRQGRLLLELDENMEIISEIKIKPEQEVVIQNKKRELTPKQKRFINASKENEKFCNSLGGYVQMCYVKNELLFNELDVDRANISRLIYLSTYIDYNNRHENLLIKYTQYSSIEPMDRSDLKSKLRLSDRAFINFLNDVKKNNLLYEADGKFYISPDYFSKGKCNFSKKEYTRIFINTSRMLYEHSSVRQHKQLSYIFQLIPFMNYELNIICENPDETDFTKLKKLRLSDICNILGVATNTRQAMNKLLNTLLDFYIIVEGKKYCFLSYARIKNGYGLADYFVVNPQLAWSGKDIDEVKQTINTCFFG